MFSSVCTWPPQWYNNILCTQQLLAGVKSLEPGVAKLQEGKHPEADPIQQRYRIITYILTFAL